ncbi:MAG: hypothetical protein U1F07_00870 [Rubrivivax sp.]
MRRRGWLKLGIAGGALLALAGGGLALVRPGWAEGRLTPAGRALFAAAARAVLDGVLPDRALAAAEHERAIAAHLERLEGTIAALPASTQAEIAQLAALLLHPLGRRLIAGLASDWPQAGLPELRKALQGLRDSSFVLEQQAFHALRDLTNGAYFADPATWPAIGYPGPQPI